MATAAILRMPLTNRSVNLTDSADACRLCQEEINRSHLGHMQIAARSGIGHHTIARIAYGDTKLPRFETVVRVLKALGWSVYASR